LLAGNATESIIARQQAGSSQSGPATRDRTPKRAAPALAIVALSACPDESFRSLFRPAL